MKLDATYFRYITKDEFRVLTAVEMGMRNHELVPTTLVESIARLTRGGVFKILQTLLRHKLVAHEGKKYDGYRLTYHGFDFLALRALVARGTIVGVGRRIGVGKESDVHCAQGPNGEVYAMKLHRLGRISFRNIKQKRDYLRHRTHGSWMYMARLAAVKEFAYMKALKDEDFPVPMPIDQNRHVVIMSLLEAIPMYRITEMIRPERALERLMRLLVRLARAGIVHGDFNEFNLMLDKDERIFLIDFPQIIHLNHPNAEEQFDRDVRSVCDFFRKRMSIEVEVRPSFAEVLEEVARDGVGALATVKIDGITKSEDAMLVGAHTSCNLHDVDGDGDVSRSSDGEAPSDQEEDAESDDVQGADDVDCVANRVASTCDETYEGLLPEEGRNTLLDEEGESPTAAAMLDFEVSTPVVVAAVETVCEEEVQSSSDDNASDGPGQVKVSTGGRKVRRRQTAKEARTNLQKQQKHKPAKANNQKIAQMRKAKHDVKEYFA